MRKYCNNSLVLLIILLLFQTTATYSQIGKVRVWTDTQGKQVEAQLLKIEAEAVLLKVGNKEFLLDLNRLSKEDQDYVKKLRPMIPEGQIGAMRMWTNTLGKQVEARLTRIIDNASIQIRVGKKEYTVPLAKLSEADRKYVDGLRPEPPAGKVLVYAINPNEKLKTWLVENHMQSLQWKGAPRPLADEYTLPFQLHAPPETEANRGKKLPLLVHLHGTGGIGTDNLRQFICGGGVAKVYVGPSFQNDQATYVMIPQTSKKSGWYSLSYTDPSYALRAIVHSIRILAETPGYRIDLSQIYITGLSMGGAGAFQAMAKFPGFFAGAVPIAYVDTPKIFHEGNVGPMWIVLNSSEQNYVKRLDAFREHYNNMGGNIEITINDKKGHDAWNRLVRDPKFRDWLFRRQPELFEK
jgi:hypothetical protein